VSGVGYRRWSGYGGIERSGGIEEGTDEEAAPTLGLKLHVLRASTERAFEPAFAALKQLQAGGMGAEQLSGVNRPTYAHCEVFAF
jgi:hypothetical protein